MMNRLPTVAAVAVLVVLLPACGEDEEPAPSGPCANNALEVMGAVGDIDSAVTEASVGGFLDSGFIAVRLGDVEYTPAGGSPEMRPRLITFSTNAGDPEGNELQTLLNRRVNEDGQPDLSVVTRELTEYCDPTAGEICVRFGLDNNRNDRLEEDTVIHEGLSGTVSITRLTPNVLAAQWEVDFGPNIQNQFDESSGSLTGCFETTYGQPQDNRFPFQ